MLLNRKISPSLNIQDIFSVRTALTELPVVDSFTGIRRAEMAWGMEARRSGVQGQLHKVSYVKFLHETLS